MLAIMANLAVSLAFALTEIGTADAKIEPAVVSKLIVYPGQIIEFGALTVVDAAKCTNCETGFMRDIGSVVGKIAVRTLLPGKLIFSNDLRDAPAILRGQIVTAHYRKGALQISFTGTSLSDAAENEKVAIRGNRSEVTIYGVVQRDGSIEVDQ